MSTIRKGTEQNQIKMKMILPLSPPKIRRPKRGRGGSEAPPPARSIEGRRRGGANANGAFLPI